MDLEGFDNLINCGRNLINDFNSTRIDHAHEEFNSWIDDVATWLQKVAPNTSLSAEWSSLGRSYLIVGNIYNNDPIAWVNFCAVVDRRLAWLSRFARAFYSVAKNKEQKTELVNPSNKIFIVHGRNEGLRESVARFLENLDLEAIILHEQADKGRTIIEKFIDYSDVSFAIVILSADDKGGLINEKDNNLKPRARQNVLLELGFFLGRLSRERVCILYEDGVEIPSDYQGVLYIPIDPKGAWKMLLAKEMKSANVPFDLNKAI